jgi:hypothetical protein
MKKCSPSMLRLPSLMLEWLPSKTPPTKNVGDDLGKRNPHTLLVGM